MRLSEFLEWAKEEKDKRGRSLLERARDSLLSGSFHRYNPTENSCTCPYFRRTGKTCKHMVALVILRNRKALEKNSRWREFFREYDRQVEKVVEEIFSNF